MKKYLSLLSLFIALTLSLFYSCGGGPESQNESVNEEVTEEAAEEVTKEDTINSKTNEKNFLEDYKVILSVDSIINKNETGILQVWIGAPHIKVSVSDGMTHDESVIPAKIGDYAKITPIAPEFEVKKTSEEKCYKIHPSGSNVRFLLKPKMTGTYKVSANIEIFEGTECTGTSIPKTSEILTVTVDVNTKKEICKKTNELLNIVWEKFTTFWGGLITLFFTVLLFLVRRKIKRKTNFE